MTSFEYLAWNPGIESEITPGKKIQETVYLSDYTATAFDLILELVQMMGLSHEELIHFHSERLLLH